MILNLCKDPSLLEFMVIANTVITLMQIFVPVIIILLGSLQLLKAVSASNSEGIKKAKEGLAKKAVAMVIVFLIPTIIDFSVGIFDSTYDIAACWTNGTRTKVDKLYKSLASSSLKTAANYISKTDYDIAKAREYYDIALRYSNKLKDGKVKDSNIKQLDTIKTNINNMEEKKKKQDAIDKDVENKKKPTTGGTQTTPGTGGYDGPTSTGGNITDSKYTGKIPFFTQGSGAPWAGTGYCDSGNTIAYTGCGLTSMAMCINGYGTDKSVNPGTLRNKVCSAHPGHSGATPDSYFTDQKIIGGYGVKATTLFSESNPGQTKSMQLITECLKNDGSVIARVPGHFLVVDTINSSNQYHVLDPAGTYKKANKWWSANDLWDNILHNNVPLGRYASGYPGRPLSAWCYQSAS